MPVPKSDGILVIVLVLPLLALHWLRNIRVNDKTSYETLSHQSVQTDYLLGLRGVAALLVLTMHSGIVFKRDFTATGSIFTFALYSPAWLGMVLFFGLSGFLMAKGFYIGLYKIDYKSIVDFLIRRVLRLYPVMFVAFIIISLKEGIPRSQLLTLPLRIMTFSYIPTFGLEGLHAFWSLTTEMHFYLAVPLIFAIINLASNRVRTVLLWTTFLSVFLARLVFRIAKDGLTGWHFVYFPFYGNLDYFVAGIVAAAIATKIDSKVLSFVLKGAKVFWPVCAIVFLSYSAISYYAMSGVKVDLVWSYQFVFMVGLPSLMLGPLIFILVILDNKSAKDKSTHSRLMTCLSNVLLFVGRISISLYLIHSEVFILVQKHFSTQFYLVKFLLGLAIACVFSYLMMISFESYGILLGSEIIANRHTDRT